MNVSVKNERASRGFGASLEKVVLSNSMSLFQKDHPLKEDSAVLLEDDLEKSGGITNRICWWNPSEDHLPVEFCRNSSMHGLSFIGRPHLHLSERIFWGVAFILGVVAAFFLINDVWQRYYQNPVIVAFQAQEVDIDTIPFPSVTICSMNAFPKRELMRLQKIAKGLATTEARAAREALKYVREICHSQVSFAKEFQYAHSRGEENLDLGWNDTITEETQSQMMEFLLKHTIPCKNLIRLCMFGERHVECEQIFKPLITDYGKCCTFNILPLPLLLDGYRQIVVEKDATSFDQKSTENISQPWSNEELEKWKTWNYDRDGFLLANKSQPRPYRQKRAGMPYGLSILVDPNLNDWYCPVSDSEGFRFVLHNPLEMPSVDEFASLIPLNKEIMVEIHPEMTNADDDIRKFDRGVRNCYFPEEYNLQFYKPYTSGNCFTECTTSVLGKKCNCTYFYMPRDFTTDICNTDPQSDDYKCMAGAKIELLDTLKTHCKYCESLCESIDYHFETTMATLQDPMKLWNDPDPRHHDGPPPWANNKMSIIHTFMGSETIVPKLRKRLYGVTDLIASTGGLLGLCLGFSILSAVEVVYFLTLRTFWRICWKRANTKRNKPSTKTSFSYPLKERIIQLNPNQIPLVQHPVRITWNGYPPIPHPKYISSILLDKKGL